MDSYPENPAERSRWILERRRSIPRLAVDPFKPAGWEVEEEANGKGGAVQVVTVFLTNRECPWRCLMCDLWRHTLEASVPAGAIPNQLALALAAVVANGGGGDWIKLYNAGSFFDLRAIPHSDYPKIAEMCRSFRRVIVECHPSLVGDRVLEFQELLGEGIQLEVAMGLETANPYVLEKLNKGMTLQDFANAARFLRQHGCAVRSFALVRPPFLDEEAALEWACRTLDFAFDAGSEVVSLIPTRLGNGALEELARQGLFTPPRVETLAAALRYGLGLRRGRVFADLWDLERFVTGAELCLWKAKLAEWNRRQEVTQPQLSSI